MARTEKRKTIITTEGDTRKYRSETKRAESSTKSFAGSLNRIALAAGAAFAALTAGVLSAVKAFSKQEEAEKKLDQALKNTGRNVETLGKRVREAASEIQQFSTYGDEAVLAAAAINFGVKGLGDEIALRMIPAAVDLAAKTGRELPQAMQLLTKSIANPREAFSGLKEANVFLELESKKVIETLLKQSERARTLGNDTEAASKFLEAQTYILEELEIKVKDYAKVAADTSEGGLKQLYNALGDILEVIGEGLKPAFDDAVKSVRSFADFMLENKEAVKSMSLVVVELTKYLGAFLVVALGAKGIAAATAAVNTLGVAFRTGKVAASAFWGASTLGLTLLITELPTIIGFMDGLIDRFKKAGTASDNLANSKSPLAQYLRGGKKAVEGGTSDVVSTANDSGGRDIEVDIPVPRSDPIADDAASEESPRLQQESRSELEREQQTQAFQRANDFRTEAEIDLQERLQEIRMEADEAERERLERERQEYSDSLDAIVKARQEQIDKEVELRKAADKESERLAKVERERVAKTRDFNIKASASIARSGAEIFQSDLLYRIAQLIETVPAMFVAQGAAQGGPLGFLAALAQTGAVIAGLVGALNSAGSSRPPDFSKYHEGGRVRASKTGGEVAAILQDGESVFTKEQTNALRDMMVGGGGKQKVEITVKAGDDLSRSMDYEKTTREDSSEEMIS